MDELSESGQNATGLKICRQVLHPLLSLCSAACVIVLVGWTGAITGWMHWLTLATGFAFALERSWRLWVANPRGRERRRLVIHEIVAIVVFCVSLVLLIREWSGADSRSNGWHVFIQLGVLVSGLASLIHHQTRFTARAVHPGMMLIGSFFAVIVAGTLLLKMPRCVVPEKPVPGWTRLHQHERRLRDGIVRPKHRNVFQPTPGKS